MVRIGALVIATTGVLCLCRPDGASEGSAASAGDDPSGDLTTADMVKVGREIMDGKGLCLTCHTIGKTGALRFPDLAGVDVRAKTRVPGLSDVEYFAQSMYDPTDYIVAGIPSGHARRSTSLRSA